MTMPEPMPEALRRQYLGLLGIDAWLPRNAVDEVVAGESVPAADVNSAAPVAAESAGQRAAQLDALLGRAAPGANGVREANPSPSPDAIPSPAREPQRVEQGGAVPAERFGCTFLAAGDGLLLIAAFAAPDAPGLSSAEHEMLVRLAAALVPGRTLPSPRDFSWPPAGLRVPGMEAPGAAREALRAMLDDQRRRGTRDVAVLGDELAAVIAALAEGMGLPAPVRAPALATMLREPERKRDCWALLSPLRREPPA